MTVNAFDSLTTPTRVKGPVGEVLVEWMTVLSKPQTLSEQWCAISAEKRW